MIAQEGYDKHARMKQSYCGLLSFRAYLRCKKTPCIPTRPCLMQIEYLRREASSASSFDLELQKGYVYLFAKCEDPASCYSERSLYASSTQRASLLQCNSSFNLYLRHACGRERMYHTGLSVVQGCMKWVSLEVQCYFPLPSNGIQHGAHFDPRSDESTPQLQAMLSPITKRALKESQPRQRMYVPALRLNAVAPLQSKKR